jgi:hypothetical protein
MEENLDMNELIRLFEEKIRPHRNRIFMISFLFIIFVYLILITFFSLLIGFFNPMILILFVLLTFTLSGLNSIDRIIFDVNLSTILQTSTNLGQTNTDINNLESRELDSNDYDVLLSLDENNDFLKGASETDIDRLPLFILNCDLEEGSCSKVLFDDLIVRDCSICITKFKENDLVRTLPCFHRFFHFLKIDFIKIV